MKQYTNELTPSVLASFNHPFSAEQLANADEEQRQIFKSHIEEMKDRSLMAIWRFATTGALTRNGGKIEKASANDTFILEDGSEVTRQWLGMTLFILTEHARKSSTDRGQSIPTATAFLMLS